jgi:hypothetical protein
MWPYVTAGGEYGNQDNDAGGLVPSHEQTVEFCLA